MKCIMVNLKAEQRLGVIALVLGFLAIFAGSPYHSNEVKVNTKDIALSTVNDNDKISVTHLADCIIKGNADYSLVDLRDEKEFKTYFIPTSRNISLAQLADAPLLRNEKIILYGNDDVSAAQGWFILKSEGYKGVYILDGGLDEWKDKVLFPKQVADATPEQKAEFAKLCEVSKFFGGTPQTDASQTVKQEVKLPALEMPATTNLTAPRKKKKREGC